MDFWGIVDWWNEYSGIGEWVQALLTALAIFIALFWDKFTSWRSRPKLRILFDMKPPDCVEALHTNRGGLRTRAYSVRFRVKNTGRTTAEEAEVFAARLECKTDGQWKEVNTFQPMNLNWPHVFPQPAMVAPMISPDTYRHCELVRVHHPDERGGIAYESPLARDTRWTKETTKGTILSFDTIMKTHIGSSLAPHGTYRLHVTAAASNAKPVKGVFGIKLTGDWSDDETQMFRDRIRVKLVK